MHLIHVRMYCTSHTKVFVGCMVLYTYFNPCTHVSNIWVIHSTGIIAVTAVIFVTDVILVITDTCVAVVTCNQVAQIIFSRKARIAVWRRMLSRMVAVLTSQQGGGMNITLHLLTITGANIYGSGSLLKGVQGLLFSTKLQGTSLWPTSSRSVQVWKHFSSFL